MNNISGQTEKFARVRPERKLSLIAPFNDTPALETADLALTDDNFATIARAVRRGRVQFDNIKKSLIFILPTNGGEAGVTLLRLWLIQEN